jgi:hypothetical protein
MPLLKAQRLLSALEGTKSSAIRHEAALHCIAQPFARRPARDHVAVLHARHANSERAAQVHRSSTQRRRLRRSSPSRRRSRSSLRCSRTWPSPRLRRCACTPLARLIHACRAGGARNLLLRPSMQAGLSPVSGRCGRGEPQSRCRCGRGEPSSVADVGIYLSRPLAPTPAGRGPNTGLSRVQAAARAAPARMMESDAAISLLATTRCA